MATEQNYVSSPSGKSNITINIDPREQWLRQRLPRHLPKRINDLYLDQNSNFKSQYQRGLSVLGASGWLVVHGLGQTVPHAINLALLLQAAVSSPATVHTNTSTVYLPDDLHASPTGADQDYYSQEVPVIHIKISLQNRPSQETLGTKDQDSKGALSESKRHKAPNSKPM